MKFYPLNDPFWTLVLANYTEDEVVAYALWADELERLERARA